MKLNLGCGEDIKNGYVNVDFRKTHPSVTQVDLSKFPWPFETESADEILMLDFLEHFPYRQTSVLLIECHRILKNGGDIVIQVPDAGHLANALSGQDHLCNNCGCSVGKDKCQQCGSDLLQRSKAAMMRLYGGQDYAGNYHFTCFTNQMLEKIAKDCGFINPSYEEIDHQFKNWNFKVRFKKGDLW